MVGCRGRMVCVAQRGEHFVSGPTYVVAQRTEVIHDFWSTCRDVKDHSDITETSFILHRPSTCRPAYDITRSRRVIMETFPSEGPRGSERRGGLPVSAPRLRVWGRGRRGAYCSAPLDKRSPKEERTPDLGR